MPFFVDNTGNTIKMKYPCHVVFVYILTAVLIDIFFTLKSVFFAKFSFLKLKIYPIMNTVRGREIEKGRGRGHLSGVSVNGFPVAAIHFDRISMLSSA